MKGRRRWKWLAVGGVAGAVALGLALRHAKVAAAKSEEGEVVVASRQRIVAALEEIGSVEALRKIDVKSKVPGQVREVLVDVGARVRAGDVLVRLDPTDARHELDRALAAHAVTAASLAQAEAVLAVQARAHTGGGAATLDVLRSSAEVTRLRGQLKVERAEQAILGDRVRYTELRSPIDGVVIARNVNVGEMVTPGVAAMVDGRPLLVVGQVEKLLVRVEVSQRDVVLLRPDEPVSIRVDAVSDRDLTGRVYRLAHMAQRSERRKDSNLMVFPVDVLVEAGQAGAEPLRPGMMADVKVELDVRDAALAVPLEAIVRERGGTQVRKLDAEGKEVLVDVRLGLESDRFAEIVSGLVDGDRVRVSPVKGAR